MLQWSQSVSRCTGVLLCVAIVDLRRRFEKHTSHTRTHNSTCEHSPQWHILTVWPNCYTIVLFRAAHANDTSLLYSASYSILYEHRCANACDTCERIMINAMRSNLSFGFKYARWAELCSRYASHHCRYAVLYLCGHNVCCGFVVMHHIASSVPPVPQRNIRK